MKCFVREKFCPFTAVTVYFKVTSAKHGCTLFLNSVTFLHFQQLCCFIFVTKETRHICDKRMETLISLKSFVTETFDLHVTTSFVELVWVYFDEYGNV